MKGSVNDTSAVTSSSASVPLLGAVKSGGLGCLSSGLEYASCVAIGLPVGFLSSLSVLARDRNMPLGSLKSPADLRDLVSSSVPAVLVAGALAFIAGAGVTTFIAKRYLKPAIKEVITLFYKLYMTLLSCFGCRVVGSEDKVSFIDIFLFFWSSCTAMIFGKIGAESLSFLKVPGEIVGFTLKFLLTSTTRYMAARLVLRQPFNKNWRMKQKALNQLACVSRDRLESINIAKPTNDQSDLSVSQAVNGFLQDPDVSALLNESSARKVILNIISKLLGIIIFIISAFPMAVCFIPKAVQGLELMTHSDIGKNEGYQNISTFMVGIIFSLLTDIFYQLNAFDLPYELMLSALLVKDSFKAKEYCEVFTMSFLTVLTAAMSYGNAIGVGYVGRSLVERGYLSYLGDGYGSFIPSGLTMATMCMVWSNLQKLNNGRKYNISVSKNHHGTFTMHQVDVSNIRGLLKHKDIDISNVAGFSTIK